MDTFQPGFGAFFSVFLAASLNLALPVGILFLLYKIYAKLKSIEEHLKKD